MSGYASAQKMANAIPGLLTRWCWAGIDALGAVAFPWECPICDARSDGISPLRSAMTAAPSCSARPRPPAPLRDAGRSLGARRRGLPLCRGRALGFDAAIALGPYQGPIRQLCLLTEARAQRLARPLARRAAGRGAAGPA